MSDVSSVTDSSGQLPGKRRDVRRLAMQVLYQLDMNGLTGSPDRKTLVDRLDADFDKQTVREQGVDLAIGAWARHKEADHEVERLSPEWPTHRQPPVDRAILRLAYHEITAGLTPPKVAVNEAIELAKEYASEQSPAFINGILDKFAKLIRTEESQETTQETSMSDAQTWLEDAKDTSQ